MGINGVLYHYALTNNYTAINGDLCPTMLLYNGF